jgi:ubiquinol-cytochrome c reductase iron-sulfur subunit
VSTAPKDEGKRRFLVGATTTVGTVGLVATAVPFVQYWTPSVDTEEAGGPVDVDISKLQPGDQLTIEWRGKPIWVIRRTKDDLDQINSHNALLSDPDSTVEQQPEYAKNILRSINPEYLVLVGICTHLGCSPTYRPDRGGVSADWPGGFYCSCHGSKFDLSGRVFKGVPAPTNLVVPPYVFLDEKKIRIGVDQITDKA